MNAIVISNNNESKLMSKSPETKVEIRKNVINPIIP